MNRFTFRENRSWNRVRLTYVRTGKRFSLGGKLWYPLDLAQAGYGGNASRIRYVGYGELMAYWKPVRHAKLIADATVRKGTGSLTYYRVLSGLRFRPYKWGMYLFLQRFIGYGKNLLEYRTFTHKI